MHSRLAYIVALFGAASLQCQAALRISEFMAVNQSGLEDEDGNTPDWIEILNDSAAPADLTGYALTDDPASPTKWQLPAGLTISPGATLVVFASDKNRTPVGGELHTNFKLSSAGEYLALVAPDGITHAYQPTFPPQFPDISFGLDPSTPATGYFTTPTPGAPNGQPGPTPVGGVDFSADSQTFTSSLSVTLTNHLPGTTILYTTDGSDPATAGTVYTTPVSITTSTELRALAKLTGQNTGPATTRHYLKLAADTQSFSSPLPVVVLDNFAAGRVPQRNSSTGPNGNDGSGVIQVERQPVLMAIFDRDTQTGQATPAAPPAITSHAGIRVRGSSSSGLRKKSFSMETWQDGAREEPDNIAPFAMPSESDWILYAPTETFSGNRYDRSLLHNSFIYQLSNEIGRYAVRTQFVELFLNTGGGDLTMADYAGLYIFMEKRKRDNGRIGFDQLSQDASTGGWMISVDRMDPKPVGGTGTPRHFHTPGPDQVLQTTNDSPFGVRNRDDRPEFYHSFFNFKSPDGYAVNTAQRTAIETAMNDFEDALYAPDWTDPTTGYAAHIDVDNFIDHYILNNLTKNQDAYVLSTLIYRSTPDDPIRFGPIWDFDRGYNTSPTSTNPRANLRFADNRMWYPRLFGHTDFEQKYIDRWQQLREGLFATSHMDAIIDTQKNEITEPVALRNRTSNWPSKVATMKSWLATRTAAIDARFTPKPTFTFEGSSATISHPAYYTTDGTDPRQPGGNISPTARSTAGGQFDTTFISTGQPCRYHIPSDETLGLSWTATFDDSTWTQATPGLGWESPIVPTLTPAITTDIEDQMRRENASGYFRWQFDLDDPSTINTLTLNVTIDDGFVAYLNGIRIGDFNAPDPIAWNSEATGSRSDSAVIDTPVQIDATPFKSSLRPGTNILAIHAMNATTSGSDFLVQASLEANQSIPPGIVHLTRSTTLTARSLDGDDWSGPATQTFIVGTTPASADNLVISEIMYNPAGAGQSEYIELMNISTGPIDLSGTAFTRGIDFTFPAGNQSVLQPGARTLVAVDATGTSLDNSGETITLTALDGQPIRHFKYNDKAPWPEAADGRGFSLVLDLPNTNPDHSLAKNWRSSVAPGGSPGTTDTLTFTGDPNADPDQNGLTALLEFATADHDTTSIDAGLVFSFRRNLAAANVRYTVERSTDLITWHADTTFVDETNHTDGTATLRYRPPTEAGNQYLRLKVTLL